MRILFIGLLVVSPILAQCDWNEDGTLDIFDIVSAVNCIITECYTPSNVTDIDGNIYKTVEIGEQEWMDENLQTTHY